MPSVAKEVDAECGIVASGIQNSQVFYQGVESAVDSGYHCGSYVGFDCYPSLACLPANVMKRSRD